MIALALAMAMAAPPPPPAGALTNAQALAPYFRKLGQARSGGGRPVHILQIGDSHTAGDALTGAWRDLLQARHGGGGRGVLPPGRPYEGYLTRGVNAQMTGGWKVSAIFGANAAEPRPAMGLSGFSLTSRTPGARLTLVADPNQAFDRFTLCAAAGPGAGTALIRLGFVVERMELGSPSRRIVCRTLTAPEPRLAVEVTAEGAPITLTSWATFRDAGGVALSNVGVVGAQLVHFTRTDDATVTEELRAYRPDLIVLAFGTNEGFAPVFRPSEYEIVLRTQISRLRRLSGGVPILLLGAPDASSRRPEMLRNAAGPFPAPCAEPGATPAVARPAAPVAPPGETLSVPGPDRLAAVMAGLRDELPAEAPPPVEAAPPPLAPSPAPSAWRVAARPLFPPAGLAAVRTVQRRVAAELNLAFWDWEAAMGGRCAAVRWVKEASPLMRGDYVHFNSAGGREIAQRLQADLERAAADMR